MGMKSYKPTTPSLRTTIGIDRSILSKDGPHKQLTKGKKLISARDRNGRISVRRRGGGHKRLYRVIDFSFNKKDIPGFVRSIEYDPNRTAFISLIVYKDGEKRYSLTSKNMKEGQEVCIGENVAFSEGNSLPLKNIPLGSSVFNVELQSGKGAQLVRSAGAYAVVTAREGDYVTLKLPSGERRLIFAECYATLGVVSNDEYMNTSKGKAGRNRWLGRRPKVRGVVMNPVDHPHGGGEGKTSGGRHPVSPWGTPTKGYKTRKKRKNTNAFIVSDRRR